DLRSWRLYRICGEDVARGARVNRGEQVAASGAGDLDRLEGARRGGATGEPGRRTIGKCGTLNLKVMPGRAVEIRGCTTHLEFNECVALQRAVWHFADLDIVTADLLLLAAKTGGQVLGAFDGGQVIGFAYSVPALRSRLVYLHSHMVAVVPEHQSQGIGRQLKLAQR